MTSAEPTAIFTRSWSLYDLITEHNYMSHREIYTGVEDLLRLRSDRGNYHLLNLGLRQCTLPGPMFVGAVSAVMHSLMDSLLAVSWRAP
jgi:hypothetical protein